MNSQINMQQERHLEAIRTSSGLSTFPGISEVLSYPLSSEAYLQYIRQDVHPPLSPELISCEGVVPKDFSKLKSTTTGDLTLVLRYRGYEAALASLGLQDDELAVLQVKGSAPTRKSWRLTHGMKWVEFFADEITRIAQSMNVQRLTMPAAISGIGGYVRNIENSLDRYTHIGGMLKMEWAPSENQYVRDVRRAIAA